MSQAKAILVASTATTDKRLTLFLVEIRNRPDVQSQMQGAPPQGYGGGPPGWGGGQPAPPPGQGGQQYQYR